MATRRPNFKTGFPAIATPRQDDLRLVQQAIDAIRERFVNVETQVSFLAQVADATTSTDTITALQTSIAALGNSINAALAAQITVADQISAVSLPRRPPEPTRLRGPGMVLVSQEAGGYALDMDLAAAATFVRTVTPRPPAQRPPNDAEIILASRIFGG